MIYAVVNDAADIEYERHGAADRNVQLSPARSADAGQASGIIESVDTSALARNDPRTRTMPLPQSNQNEKPMNVEERLDRKLDRLMEEITILRVEGKLFCFDPREARRRDGKLKTVYKHTDGSERPVTIEIHPSYGQPSVLAYKVVQAVFLKIAEEGYPYTDYVTFSQRELARLVGRKWSGTTSAQLYAAIMQLQRTMITCSLHNKETKEFFEANFSFFTETLFSKKDQSIKECVLRVADPIVLSLNRRHFAYFNLERLNTLETLGMVIYKRLFFHFSNLYQTVKGRKSLRFEKSYNDICSEWLGGLKVERYTSKVEQQIGRHLEAIRASGLLHGYSIEQQARGKGLKIVFHAGDAFFEDYETYYLKEQQPRLRSGASASVRLIQQPLELVSYFHRRLGRESNTFSEKEAAQAGRLLETYSDAECRDLIDFAVEQAAETRFRMEHFGATLTYLDRWKALRTARTSLSARRAAIAACSYCDGSGYFHVKNGSGAFTAVECPHDPAKISTYEERTGLRRV